MNAVIRHNDTLIPVVGTILQSLESSNIRVESHCREGFCGACRVKVKKGLVDYINQPLGYVGDDEALACCSVPKGEVEIET